jgi:EAL and modified HD-GYP domain-containing signal transduction protein
MDTLYLTREPVVNAQESLIGYDLHVHVADDPPGQGSPDLGSASLVATGFYGGGVETAIGSCFGFVNIDRDLLFAPAVESLPRDAVVLSLSAELEPEREVLLRVRALREKGYSFALSDYRGDPFRLEPLLDQMAVVQVDFSCASSAFLHSLQSEVRRPGVRLMASEVQTPEEFERARALGFDLFEGYHFLGRARSPQSSSSGNAAALLKMLRLLKEDADSHAVVDELKRQPALAVATLRAANASSLSRSRQSISSLPDALAMLGRNRLARLVQMLVFAGSSTADLGHNPLLQVVVTRAKLMEDLAERDPDAVAQEKRSAFVVGLFSLIESALGLSLVDVLHELQYGSPVKEALLHREGRLGVLLELVEKLELGDDAAVAGILPELPSITGLDLIRIQFAALAWLGESGVR